MTIAAWFVQWAWLVWPALLTLDVIEPRYSYPDGSPASRAVAVVLLIGVNVAVWAVLLRLAWRLLARLRATRPVPVASNQPT